MTNPSEGISSDGYAVAIQPDGKILVAGDTASGNSSTKNFALLRFDENGNPDTTFDTDGVAIKELGGFADVARAIAIQSDGSIVVTGEVFISGTGYGFALVQ